MQKLSLNKVLQKLLKKIFQQMAKLCRKFSWLLFHGILCILHVLAVDVVSGCGTSGHRQDWRCRSNHIQHIPQLSRTTNVNCNSFQSGICCLL